MMKRNCLFIGMIFFTTVVGCSNLFAEYSSVIPVVIHTDSLFADSSSSALPSTSGANGSSSGSSWFRVSGSISVTADYYTLNSTTTLAGLPVWSPRQPPNLYRLIFTPTITLFDKVSIPITILLNSRETNTLTPSSLSPTLAQFLSNPLNVIGTTFNPGVDWITLSAGSHLPQYSELSGSDMQIFGGGIMLKPGIFRTAFNWGILQRAIAPDIRQSISGSYQRTLTMFKIGLGKEDGTFVDWNFVKMIDDTTAFANRLRPQTIGLIRTQVGVDSLGIPVYQEQVGSIDKLAQEGFLTSINLRSQIIDGLVLSAEVAATAFTRDQRSPIIEETRSYVPSFVFTARNSSNVDAAGYVSLSYNQPTWGIEAKTKYVGPGFVPLGFPFAQTDYLDITVAPRLQLFEGRFSFSGTFGERTNNLTMPEELISKQLLISSNLSFIPLENLTLAFTFSNFGFRNGIQNDSLRIQNVARSYSFSPTYTFSTRTINHLITTNLSFDTFEDFNVVSGRLSSNNTTTVFGMYGADLTSIPLSMQLSGTYLTNTIPSFGFTITSLALSGSYRLLDDKLIPSAGVTIGRNALQGFTPDSQLLFRVGLRYALSKMLSINSSVVFNGYKYGSVRDGASFNERTAQLGMTANF